ncbi:MAG TPA: polysaccharide lyase family protein [Acidobacteriaceae bacterium]|nr:polysaccharide lyase family protein [Acidobacteriaceae bacterium]
MKIKQALVFASILFTLPLGLIPANAQAGPSTTVFTIGKFNRSSFDFAGGTPQKPVRFIVGTSTASKDWYATQRVEQTTTPAAASHSGAPAVSPQTAPWTIQFSLANTPAPSYRFHVALLIESSSVPALRVVINGKTGTFYLQPKLDTENGDQGNAFYAAYSHADVAFEFPGAYLHRGANTITLQAVETVPPSLPNAALPADASFTYDAIQLDRSPHASAANRASAQILPTIFYQQREGQLEESVDVILRNPRPIQPGSSVDLTLAGKHFRHTRPSGHDFGEEKLSFSVPEFPAHTAAAVSWSNGGHAQHAKVFIDPQKKWTLFLVPHIHLDVGYSDYQGKVAAIHSRVIDEAMQLTAKHPDFRFSLDGYWPLQQYLETRAPAEQQRAITAIEKRQLYLPAQYASLLTGFPTAETLIRSLYASANFSRKHHTPFNYANITDVPSFSWSYASILASAGIHELFSGSDNYRAPVLLQGHLHQDSPFWWQGPDGQKVLLWYSRHYMQMQFMFGLPPSLSSGHDTLPLFLQMYQHPGYHADATILFGTQVENTDLFPQQAELAQQWDSVYAYPHIQYSGFHEALRNIAQQFGNDIPTVSGDGGPYWEDGIASDAYSAALERQNEARGPSAEELATLTSLVNPEYAADTWSLRRMWTNMVLADEHTWDSYNSVSDPTSKEAVDQLAVKELYPVKAAALADFITRNGMASIANSISTGSGSVIVFNTLNWKRSAPVSLDLNNNQELVDTTTDQVVPVEVGSGDKTFHHVRFIAQDVPAVGYKVYHLRDTKKTLEPAATTQSNTLESPYYRVTLDPATGAVRSIYDKQLQRELVDEKSPYRFGQYLYVTGGDKAPNTLLQYSRVYPKPNLDVHAVQDGHLVSVTRTPYGWVARLQSTDTNTPGISTEIRLFDHQKKIEFVEDLTKKEVDTKEGVYFAFPFAMDHPQFQYEIQNGVVDPSKNMYPGAGHEWFSVQHWVSAQQDGLSATVMPLDASLVTLGDINRGQWPTSFGTRTGTIFSYVMNNYWDTNYRAGQGGHFRFRYVITSASATDDPQLSHLGWEEMTPLEKDEITPQDKALNTPGPLDGKQGSFLHASDADLALTAWKPAEDGHGTILRFLDLGGVTRTVTVEAPLLQLQQAWQTDAVERNQSQLSLSGAHQFQFTVHPHEIVTVRLITSATPRTSNNP